MSEKERRFQGLDVQAVLEAHLAWRKRLEDAIEGRSNEELDLSVIVRDDQCQLGRWIYLEAAKTTLALHPEFARLREAHRQFHLVAARVVQTFRLHGFGAAQGLLTGEFDQRSKEIVQSLADLMQKERSLD
ncbi:MAG: CZB domain-containing protein [Meiothermus sp.]|uniref:CZB domain-containing protein n=1 Tax=Meiothermus sp. TaxID=1955249 RepID=UPI0025F4E302|nr:CZB domain-containing protein [Meiothermus sp.]MCS7068960.1 CZB domain-containing protein [Meiothermus sp.]MCX7601448.1 CZB domain-containing protein [Meiothermus sp.]MDW8426464.1 CZB domain-containing protein [Meiothermus sp.]